MAMTRAEQRDQQDLREFEQDVIQQLRERGIQALSDLVRQAQERGFLIGMRRALLCQLRIRFGCQVDGDPERRVASASLEQLASKWSSGRIASCRLERSPRSSQIEP